MYIQFPNVRLDSKSEIITGLGQIAFKQPLPGGVFANTRAGERVLLLTRW